MSEGSFIDKGTLTLVYRLLAVFYLLSCGWHVAQVHQITAQIAVEDRKQEADPMSYGIMSSHGGTPQYWLNGERHQADLHVAHFAWRAFVCWVAATVVRRRRAPVSWSYTILVILHVIFASAMGLFVIAFFQHVSLEHTSTGWLLERLVLPLWVILCFVPLLGLASLIAARLYRNRAEVLDRVRDQLNNFANSNACCFIGFMLILGPPVTIPLAYMIHTAVHHDQPLGFDSSQMGWFERHLGIGRDVGDYLLDDVMWLYGKDHHEWQWDLPVTYTTLEVEADSRSWAPDTSLGLEFWGEPGGKDKHSPHFAVLFRGGELIVRNPAAHGTEHREPVNYWNRLVYCGSHTFTFIWKPSAVVLKIDGKRRASYSGPMVPARSLRVRFNADERHGDLLRVYRFEIKKK